MIKNITILLLFILSSGMIIGLAIHKVQHEPTPLPEYTFTGTVIDYSNWNWGHEPFCSILFTDNSSCSSQPPSNEWFNGQWRYNNHQWVLKVKIYHEHYHGMDYGAPSDLPDRNIYWFIPNNRYEVTVTPLARWTTYDGYILKSVKWLGECSEQKT